MTACTHVPKSVALLAVGAFLPIPMILSQPAADTGSDGTYSFVVFGDNQFATGSPTSGVPERMAVPEAIRRLGPDLVLHTGDLMDHGWDEGAYDRFVEYYEPMIGECPFFPTMGNHDAARGGIRAYRTFLEQCLFERNARIVGPEYESLFRISYADDTTPYSEDFRRPTPAPHRARVPSGVSFKTFYAFRHRNSLFISFEQGTRWWANTPLPWLEKHLAAAHADETVDHVFVYLHHPIYSSTMRDEPPDPANPGSGECTGPVRKIYEPLFRRYNVTMVFSGHAHLYDRFYVPDDGHPTRTEKPPARYPHDGGGIHYIVTGGGGGPLNRGGWGNGPGLQHLQKRACVYHVTEVAVAGPRLTVRARQVGGSREAPTTELLDEFRILP